jgi:nitroreductase
MKHYFSLLLLSSSLCFAATDTTRKAEYAVDDIFLNRWSARAMSGKEISDAELFSLFDAAHWAPSEYNSQPWRFIYVKRGTKHWNNVYNLLVPFNQEWCKNASVLVVMLSRNHYENGDLIRTHSFDAGAAWQNLALQASMRGLVAHGMSGFDYDRAKKDLQVPDGYTVEAMCAIGYPASPDVLPEGGMREGEKKRSGRKPLKEFVSEGVFQSNIK